MVRGVGTDLVEVNRIFESISKNPKFLCRFFSVSEQVYFLSILNNTAVDDPQTPTCTLLTAHYHNASLALKSRLAQSVAANFAGKEAVLKVFGTGLRNCKLEEIEILRGDLGQPYVKLSGSALNLSRQLGINDIQMSLSHTKEHALAFAIGI